MCELFDDRRISQFVTVAAPNGKYQCYHCTPIAAGKEVTA